MEKANEEFVCARALVTWAGCGQIQLWSIYDHGGME